MTTVDHKDIRNLRPNEYIDGVYAVVNPQLGMTRAGKPFLKCLLRDATGECPARQWTVDESVVSEIGSTGFVWIAGHTQLYDEKIQVILEQIRPVTVDDEAIQRLLPSSSRDLDEMFEEVRSVLGTLEHSGMRALAEAYLTDEKLMNKFRHAPAAVSLHHAWIGGLLEHTSQLLRLADSMLPLYPQLNRDLVLVGLFLHDLAKTSELSWEKGFEYTTLGNLMGHVVLGSLLLERKLREVVTSSGAEVPARARVVLHHIILSHHNEPEFGAAKRPSTPEAIFVSMLDNLDAKTSMALAQTRGDTGPDAESTAEFTEKVWALDTRLYRPDPLAE